MTKRQRRDKKRERRARQNDRRMYVHARGCVFPTCIVRICVAAPKDDES